MKKKEKRGFQQLFFDFISVWNNKNYLKNNKKNNLIIKSFFSTFYVYIFFYYIPFLYLLLVWLCIKKYNVKSIIQLK